VTETAAYVKQQIRIEIPKRKAFFTVFPGLCKGCGLCKEKCPEQALSWSEKLGVYGTPTVVPDPELCKACRICEQTCPDCAIIIEREGKNN
jgi:2-oxoglutarate ferredoxin oxidoreductase subunit delta